MENNTITQAILREGQSLAFGKATIACKYVILHIFCVIIGILTFF
jgi:hypothetical protein